MLSQDQVSMFNHEGYLRLPGVLSDFELEGMRAAVDRLLVELGQLPPSWREDFHHGGLLGDAIGKGSELCRLEYTFQKDPRFVAVLGNPRVIGVPVALHDSAFVVTWEDLVIKMPNAYDVPWHQDADHQSVRGRVFSVGIYLDDSVDDPLMVLPGTQALGPLSEEEVEHIVEERQGEAVCVPVRGGDAIVHNVRVIHGSGQNTGSRPRRVLYLEFRSVDQVRTDSPWDESWLRRRMPYVPLGIKLRHHLGLDAHDDVGLTAELARVHPEWFVEAQTIDPSAVDLRVHHEEIADAL